MRDIHDIIAAATANGLPGHLAAQSGVSADEAGAVIAAALPHLSALMGEPGLLPNVIKSALQGVHQRSFEAPQAAASGTATGAGEQALKDLLGNSQIVTQVAARISARVGVPESQVAALLPAIASVVLGGIWHAMEQRGLGAALGKIGAALTQSGGARSATPGPAGLETAPAGPLAHVLHSQGSAPVAGADSEMEKVLAELRALLAPRGSTAGGQTGGGQTGGGVAKDVAETLASVAAVRG